MKIALISLILLFGCSNPRKDVLPQAATCYLLTSRWSALRIYRCRIEYGPVCYVADRNGTAMWCER